MAGHVSEAAARFGVETHLLFSRAISDKLGCDVYLKLENLHPPQSFKHRGILLEARKAKDLHGPSANLVIASGGNGGVAAAYAAEALNIQCTVFLPEHTNAEIVAVLKRFRAQVVLSGDNYYEALGGAQQFAASQENAVIISSYDGDTLREGHSSLITEIHSQLRGVQPDAIFCSVGGGGLLGGLLVGCRSVGWDDTSIVALETRGADCFYYSMLLNRPLTAKDAERSLPPGVTVLHDEDAAISLAHFSTITSKACLGAASPAPAVVRMALQRTTPVTCVVVPDEMSMHAAVCFARDHKTIVELACSTTLTPAYSSSLFNAILPLQEDANAERKRRAVVFIVCGSANITLEEQQDSAPVGVFVESELTVNDTLSRRASNGRAQQAYKLGLREWFRSDILGFFFLGILVPAPTMVVVSGARLMFVGSTGISGVCLALPAAVTSFTVSFFVHYIPYSTRVLLNVILAMLSLAICTAGASIAGPVVGTVVAGFVYAFGSNTYLSAAAFYDQRTVIAFSIGTGMAAIVGPLIYIMFMAIFHDDWRMTYRVTIPLPALQLLLWWLVLSKKGRVLAEQTRAGCLSQDPRQHTDSETPSITVDERPGFGPERTRTGLFFKVILLRYVVPQTLCTMGALFALQGLVPTFLALRTFKAAPEGDLNYQLNFLIYGTATFIFSLVSMVRAFPQIWLWATMQWVLVTIGIIQLFVPFLNYFAVWIIFIFVIGGIVGGANTNTCYKIAEDFRRKGEPEVVRSFAMSYGVLGNFAGDAIGGGIAVLVQRVAESNLPVRSW
ncbi:hypothetical protein VTN77DRAFT_3163 [Rasamsonia byssochlamydoides]|uniref:uncharacterized protein n=1 Tax=Rasamsonia byssochlamydoides TaxID=89139 RepID=UPI003743AB80